MDSKTARHFAEIIELAQSIFENVTYEIDTTPNRSILGIEAEYGRYQILITELFSDGTRKYRYYVMRENWVEAGFDNSPDPRAIRFKYGRIDKDHVGEYIPHLHLENKTRLSLTDEMTFTEFVHWLKSNV